MRTPSPSSVFSITPGPNDLRLFPNDGVVRVDSARWGRFRGCLLTDHMGEVGQGNDAGKIDHRSGFDVYAFYAQTAAALVREHQP